MIIKGILLAAGSLLAILGLCGLIHEIRLSAIMGSHKNNMISVVKLEPGTAALQLMFAAEQLNWLGKDFATSVIGLTDTIDGAELDDCRRIAKRYEIILCSTSEAASTMRDL